MFMSRLSSFVAEGLRHADETPHERMTVFRLDHVGGEATERAAQQFHGANSRPAFPIRCFGFTHKFLVSATPVSGVCG
jgi:hypothetical protein